MSITSGVWALRGATIKDYGIHMELELWLGR